MNFNFKKTAIVFLLAIFIITNILVYPFEAIALSTSGGVKAFATAVGCYGKSGILSKAKGYAEKLVGKKVSGAIGKAKSAVVNKGKEIFNKVFKNKAKDAAEKVLGKALPPSILGGGARVPTRTLGDESEGGIYNETKKGFDTLNNYKKDEKKKERCEDSIVSQMAKFLIRKMVDDLAKWIRGGAQGKPRFIQDFGKYLSEAGDVAGGLFLEQLMGDASPLCEPWKLDIALNLPKRKGFSFDAQCKISEIVNAYNLSGINVDINGNPVNITIEDSFNDFSKTGWAGYFTMIFNNPIGDTLDALQELENRKNLAKEKAKLEAQVNQGLLISSCTKEFNGLGGKKCSKWEITTPGVAIASAVGKLFPSNIDELFLADEINELVAATIDGIKSRRLWSDEGVSGFSSSGGRGGWLSDDDPLNTGEDIFNPPNIILDSTEESLISALDDFIFEETDYLTLKQESLKVINTEILVMMDDLIAKTKKKKDKKDLEKQKKDFEKQIIVIDRQITESKSLVYEKDGDPIEKLLTIKYPNWVFDTEQREDFCAEPTANSNELRLLPMTKAEVICAVDQDKINELADFINNDLYLMLGSASDAASEYENITSVRSDLRDRLNLNPPLGSHESNDNATCSIKGWAYDTDTPGARVNIRALLNEDESSAISGVANIERNEIAVCTPEKFCGFEISLIGAVASSTPTSITVQAQDTSDEESWSDLEDTPKEITCV